MIGNQQQQFSWKSQAHSFHLWRNFCQRPQVWLTKIDPRLERTSQQKWYSTKKRVVELATHTAISILSNDCPRNNHYIERCTWRAFCALAILLTQHIKKACAPRLRLNYLRRFHWFVRGVFRNCGVWLGKNTMIPGTVGWHCLHSFKPHPCTCQTTKRKKADTFEVML